MGDQLIDVFTLVQPLSPQKPVRMCACMSLGIGRLTYVLPAYGYSTAGRSVLGDSLCPQRPRR